MFILCLALGKTKAELFQTLTSYELFEWFTYYKVQPFGALRGDIQAGVVASTIANVNRGKDTPAFTPTDFLIFERGEGSSHNPELEGKELDSKLIDITRKLGGKIISQSELQNQADRKD